MQHADSRMLAEGSNQEVQDSETSGLPDWCVCGRCRPMSEEIENKCCKLKKCIT